MPLDEKWIEEFRGIGKSHRGNYQQCMEYNSLMTIIIGNTFAHCSLCSSDFGISHGGRNDVTTHVKGTHHREMDAAASTTQSVRSFFRPEMQKSVTEAEARWLLYVTKHNLSFQASDHATKLFKVMFSDSNITKNVYVVIPRLPPLYQKPLPLTINNP